jgi:hypothetical protein
MKTIFMIIIIILMTGIIIHLHETVHSIIFHNYGIDSQIKLFCKSGSFIGLACAEAEDTEDCNDSCILAHHINDIIFYNAFVIYILIWIIIFILNENLEN